VKEIAPELRVKEREGVVDGESGEMTE